MTVEHVDFESGRLDEPAGYDGPTTVFAGTTVNLTMTMPRARCGDGTRCHRADSLLVGRRRDGDLHRAAERSLRQRRAVHEARLRRAGGRPHRRRRPSGRPWQGRRRHPRHRRDVHAARKSGTPGAPGRRRRVDVAGAGRPGRHGHRSRPRAGRRTGPRRPHLHPQPLRRPRRRRGQHGRHPPAPGGVEGVRHLAGLPALHASRRRPRSSTTSPSAAASAKSRTRSTLPESAVAVATSAHDQVDRRRSV